MPTIVCVLKPKVKFSIAIFLLLVLGGCTSLQKPVEQPLEQARAECVILLHGLFRTPNSMAEMDEKLAEAGYLTVNDGYPSRDAEIDVLADLAIPPAVSQCRELGADRINFVTHSLGGILVRHYLSANAIAELGRVVMLGPPNNGSEVVDKFRGVPGFAALYGPAVLQLGTDHGSVPLQLGAADFEVGIIAGDNGGLFSGMLADEDDGTVTVESTRLEGMTAFLLADAGHTFIMANNEVIRQTIFFLDHGRFDQ